MSVPILFLSDAADRQTGLGRITRDLASLLSRSPHFRVGTLGLGAVGSRKLPFQQYAIQQVGGQWGEGVLERVWADFAGTERGIVMTIWDASRVLWFSRPEFAGDSDLSRFLSSHHFERWGYFPIDGAGPGGRLSSMSKDALLGYDRIVAYTKWAEGLVRTSLGDLESERRNLNWIPHGINMDIFQPRDKAESRRRLSPIIHDDDLVVGVIGTNQPRKDWGLMASVCQQLRTKVKNLRLWWHIDMMERHWSIPALLADFGLQDITVVTHSGSDADLSYAYSACDVTLHPGLGEGFGYGLAESLSCGVPIVHGDYAGGADWLRQAGHGNSLVPVQAYRLDTLHNVVRPVFDPKDWVEHILGELIDVQNGKPPEYYRASVAHFDWKNLWPVWEKWFLDGAKLV